MKTVHPRATALLALALSLLGPALSLGRERPIRFLRLSTEQGLSDNTVEAIVQDPQGFMWFGTADGLNRYDGYEFKVFRHEDERPTSLSDSYVWDLLVDSEGALWVGTAVGLNRFDPKTESFAHWHHEPGVETTLTTPGVLDLLEDSRGTLWAGGGGLNRFDRSTGLFTRYLHDEADPRSLSYSNVQAIYEDRAGRLWIGTGGGGLNLYHYETDDFSHYRHDPADPSSLSNDTVRAILEDSRGHLWVGTEKGLNRMDPAAPGRFVRYELDLDDPTSLAGDLVWTIHEDSQGVLWIGTDHGGLASYDPERDEFERYLHDPSDPTTIAGDAVYFIYEDSAGDLWTAHYADGISYFDRQRNVFDFYTHRPSDPDSLNHKSVISVAEDSQHRVWVGTEQGLASLDRASGRFVRYEYDPRDLHSVSAPAVLTIGEDSAGRIWVGTYAGGLNSFDPETGRFFRRFPTGVSEPGAGELNVNAVLEDRSGDLWIGTFEGVFRLDPGGNEKAFYTAVAEDPTSIGHVITWEILEDRAGRLWFGTQWGLSLYDPDGNAFVTYRHEPNDPTSLSHDAVFTLYEDEHERLWLGTHGGGLNLFDPEEGSFTAYGTDEGLPSNVVLGIVGSPDGDLWLSTNAGLARFDPRTGEVDTFDEGDGLEGRQFNRNALLLSRDGELLFGGTHGLNVFDPAAIEPNPTIAPVVLTGFQVFNRPVEIGPDGPLEEAITVAEEITLDYSDSVVTFDFAALSYRSPLKNRYAYMLEGFDTDWIHSGARRETTYTNLDPGSYTFRVKATNNSGVWNEAGRTVDVTVRPPFWARWWFRLTLFLAGATVLLSGYRWRVREISERSFQLQKEVDERKKAEIQRERLIRDLRESQTELEAQNQELERFAYTVSHDLKSPLVTIQGFASLLRKDVKTRDADALERDVEQITSAAGMMNRLLNETLDLARIGRVAGPVEEVSLFELAREAVDHGAGRIQGRGVEVEVLPSLPVVRCDRMRVLEVFQNLVDNACKFMGDQSNPRIEIGARVDGDETVCYVKDNGMGINPQFQERVFKLFERLEANTQGSGVGLTLVKRIIEVHGGRVWVESDGLGSGCAVCFVLPEGSGGGAASPLENSSRE